MKMNAKNQQLRIKGKQIFLRYPQAEDADEFIELNKRSRKLHRGLTYAPTDKESYISYVRSNEDEAVEKFFICENECGKIMGAINLSQIFRRGFQNAYLGYFMGADFAGRGFMSEAVALILRYAFKTLKLHRIEANVQPHNHASIAILRKNNFTKEGFSEKYLKIGNRWRDHERWAIVIENWKTANRNGK